MLLALLATAYAADTDGDGHDDAVDVCVLVADPLQADTDGDGTGDACDVCPGPGDGLTLFPAQTPVSTAVNGAISVGAADLDGDGDLDLMSASGDNDRIAWYANLGGGTFGGQSVLTSLADDATDVRAADMDGDGDLDVLACSNLDDTVSWFPRGAGAFGAEVVLGTADAARRVLPADLDGDGDLDVVVGAYRSIAWHANLGGGAFGGRTVITSAIDGLDGLDVGDLDGDGDVDLVYGNRDDDEVAWFRNDGAGAFAAPTVIDAESDGREVEAVDFDGDGDLDVLAAQWHSRGVGFYENLGGGSFAGVASIGAVGARVSVHAVDLDGDGLLDVVSGSDQGYFFSQLALGGGAFAPEVKVVLSTNAGPIDVDGADLDGDGDPELLVAWGPDTGGGAGDFVGFYENRWECYGLDGDGDGLRDAEELLVHGTDPADADTDGDGADDRAEVAAGTDAFDDDTDDDGVLDGADGCPFDPINDDDLDGICGNEDNCPDDANPAQDDGDADGVGDACDRCAGDDATFDVDRDGVCNDADLCLWVDDPDQLDADGDGTGDACDVCDGPGDGLELFPELITSGPGLSRMGAALGDLDGDGDLDALSVSHGGHYCDWSSYYPTCWYQPALQWNENVGGQFVWPSTTIAALNAALPFEDLASGVAAADLDGDGDLDAIWHAAVGGIRWYENLGGGVFAPAAVVGPAGRPLGLLTPDLDADGDPDVLALAYTAISGVDIDGDGMPDVFQFAFAASWYQNLGAGAFAAPVPIGEASRAEVADLDLDGDLDLVVAGDDDTAYYLNLGGGTFGSRQEIEPAYSRALELADGDGDEDLYTGGAYVTSWFENTGGAFGSRRPLDPEPSQAVRAADLDGDGDLDLLSVYDYRYGLDVRAMWRENQGGGVFGPRRFTGADIEDLGLAEPVDFDGDGDLDLVSEDLDVWENRLDCYALDTDADLLTDAEELLLAGTDPADADSDEGSVDDATEVAAGTDPRWGGDDLPPSDLVRLPAPPGVWRFGADNLVPGLPVALWSSETQGSYLAVPECSPRTELGLDAPATRDDAAVAAPSGRVVLETTAPPGFVGTRYFVAIQPASCRVSDIVAISVP